MPAPDRAPLLEPARTRLRVLLLGGTTEGGILARALAGRPDLFEAVLSLAGRTAAPRVEPVPTRSGGFGGADGLAAWIAGNDIDLVVDATHPFAARISGNAALACARTGARLLAVRRPAWDRHPDDRWVEAADMDAAAEALGPAPLRVFLTIGRGDLAAFARAPQHDYLVRTIEPVEALPLPRWGAVLARGPFGLEAETRFLVENRIAVLVSKNAGGAATYAKIAAARALGLPVVMVARPALPAVEAVPDATTAFARLLRLAQAGTERRV